MTAGTISLICSICGEPSTEICVYCTKDACANHRCARCKRCSDCCECDAPLSLAEADAVQEAPPETASEVAPAPEAEALQQDAPIEIGGENEVEQPQPSPPAPPGEEILP